MTWAIFSNIATILRKYVEKFQNNITLNGRLGERGEYFICGIKCNSFLTLHCQQFRIDSICIKHSQRSKKKQSQCFSGIVEAINPPTILIQLSSLLMAYSFKSKYLSHFIYSNFVFRTKTFDHQPNSHLLHCFSTTILAFLIFDQHSAQLLAFLQLGYIFHRPLNFSWQGG